MEQQSLARHFPGRESGVIHNLGTITQESRRDFGKSLKGLTLKPSQESSLREGNPPLSFSEEKGISLVILVLIVLASASGSSFLISTASLPSPQSVPLTQSVMLDSGYYNNYEIDAFSNSTLVEYAASSDVPVSTALMTALQYNDFANNPSDPVSNSITYQNGTSAQNSVVVPQGQYFLVFYAYLSGANVQFGYEVYPNTPFSYGAVSPPLASGIASFGVYNNSGVVTPYEIRTNQIVGVANISAFQVLTLNAAKYGVSVTGATLQLNALLVVQDSGSSDSAGLLGTKRSRL